MKSVGQPTYNTADPMMTCRSVSPAAWEHARQALVFYFTRRCGFSGAEDLAHETLAAILNREDYEFEKEEDFLRVCYGFATHILQASRRDAGRSAGEPATPVPSPRAEAYGLKDAELNVYLKEVLRLGKSQLRDSDWQLVHQSVVLGGDKAGVGADAAEANNARVKLHRARRKLARLAGLRKV